MSADSSPFRPKPLPLAAVRSFIRWCRLQRVKGVKRRRFTHGTDIAFATGADIRAPRYVELGHHVSIGKNFTCDVDLRVGSFVLISGNVAVVGKDHLFDDPEQTVYSQKRLDDSNVEIGSDVLIGFGSIIVGTVKIGDGCIVGAGSVVTRDLPPYSVCGGVPAKVIRARYPDKV